MNTGGYVLGGMLEEHPGEMSRGKCEDAHVLESSGTTEYYQCKSKCK